jgi:membrane protein required for colicin V production
MNLLDVVVLALIGISGLMSLRVGLIREVFALGALLLGLFGAVVLGRGYAASIPDFLGNRVATQLVFFLASFLIIYLLISLLGSVFGRLLSAMHLRSVDRLLGFLFGAVRGAILAFLVMLGLVFILPDDHSLLVGSRAYALAEKPMRVFSELLPEQARKALQEKPTLKEILRRGDSRKDSGKKGPLEGIGIPL